MRHGGSFWPILNASGHNYVRDFTDIRCCPHINLVNRQRLLKMGHFWQTAMHSVITESETIYCLLGKYGVVTIWSLPKRKQLALTLEWNVWSKMEYFGSKWNHLSLDTLWKLKTKRWILCVIFEQISKRHAKDEFDGTHERISWFFVIIILLSWIRLVSYLQTKERKLLVKDIPSITYFVLCTHMIIVSCTRPSSALIWSWLDMCESIFFSQKPQQLVVPETSFMK